MNNQIISESTFESAIIDHLVGNNWLQGNDDDFNSDLVLDANSVLTFIKTSQPIEWEFLKSYYKEEAENKFIKPNGI